MNIFSCDYQKQIIKTIPVESKEQINAYFDQLNKAELAEGYTVNRMKSMNLAGTDYIILVLNTPEYD